MKRECDNPFENRFLLEQHNKILIPMEELSKSFEIIYGNEIWESLKKEH